MYLGPDLEDCELSNGWNGNFRPRIWKRGKPENLSKVAFFSSIVYWQKKVIFNKKKKSSPLKKLNFKMWETGFLKMHSSKSLYDE